MTEFEFEVSPGEPGKPQAFYGMLIFFSTIRLALLIVADMTFMHSSLRLPCYSSCQPQVDMLCIYIIAHT